MNRGLLALACGAVILTPCTPLPGEVRPAEPLRAGQMEMLASPANISQYLRDRLQVPDDVPVNVTPLQRSGVPHFYQMLVTIPDGKQSRVFNAFLSDDARCFAVGSAFALNGASEAEIIRCIRQAASLPASAKVTIGTFVKSPLGLLRSAVTVELGGRSETAAVFLTPDRRAGILGVVWPYRRDFVEQLTNTQDQPSAGAAHARVTIVEYADLECPRCAYYQKFLESEFLPKYGSRVRIVFKEFPLSFHPWSTTAAVANECAYQIDPSEYLAYRSSIFANQDDITTVNLRDRLLRLAQMQGLNRVELGACLDSKASKGRVNADRLEAETLGINGTPTFVVNGRVVLNPLSPTAFYETVDEALAAVGK